MRIKIPFLGGESSLKKQKNREDCLKTGLGQLADLIEGLAKKKSGAFEGVISQYTLWI